MPAGGQPVCPHVQVHCAQILLLHLALEHFVQALESLRQVHGPYPLQKIGAPPMGHQLHHPATEAPQHSGHCFLPPHWTVLHGHQSSSPWTVQSQPDPVQFPPPLPFVHPLVPVHSQLHPKDVQVQPGGIPHGFDPSGFFAPHVQVGPPQSHGTGSPGPPQARAKR